MRLQKMTTHDYFHDLQKTVHLALEEDIGAADLTASLIAADAITQATVTLREMAVICGRPWFDETFHQLDPNIQIDWHIQEGSVQPADTKLCTLRGNTRQLLTGERTALNFLQTLSATATLTRQYVEQLKNTKTTIITITCCLEIFI